MHVCLESIMADILSCWHCILFSRGESNKRQLCIAAGPIFGIGRNLIAKHGVINILLPTIRGRSDYSNQISAVAQEAK